MLIATRSAKVTPHSRSRKASYVQAANEQREQIMVYFEDMGTTIGAPLEELESFLEWDEHSSAHSDDVRNFEVAENFGATIVVTYERRFDGQWKKSRTRLTSFPPYCRCVEEIEGDFAGSRFVVVHRPDGAKTTIDVFGDIQCKGRTPEQIRKLWLDILAKSHDEDVAMLRKFRDRRQVQSTGSSPSTSE
jgi:hypothetical protein